MEVSTELWCKQLNLYADVVCSSRKHVCQRPVLLYFHGGGMSNVEFTRKRVMPVAHAFADAGFLVVCPDYRNANLDKRVYLNNCIEDALGALVWTKQNAIKWRGDPSRVIVGGSSAGAVLAAMVGNVCASVNTTNNRMCSGFDGFEEGNSLSFCPSVLPRLGTTDWNIALLLLNFPSTDHLEQLESLPGWQSQFPQCSLFGCDWSPTQAADMYKACSPLHTLPPRGTRSPPTRIFVGSCDKLVYTPRPTMLEEFVQAVAHNSHGNDVSMHVFPQLPHDFLRPGAVNGKALRHIVDAVSTVVQPEKTTPHSERLLWTKQARPFWGTWMLCPKGWTMTTSTQPNQVYPMGPRAFGHIMYAPDAYMSVLIATTEPLNPATVKLDDATPVLQSGTNEQCGKRFRQIVSYFGNYTFDSHNGKRAVTHHIVNTTHVPQMFHKQVREYHFSPDMRYLTLRAHLKRSDGTIEHHVLKWQRPIDA